jgi:hypothetical protein
MSSSDVARSERVLDKIGARLGLTPEGKQWLIAAIDPFHDTPVDCRGFPDTNEAASVVQVIKMSAQISQPGVTAGTNWDLHIHSFPWEQVLIGTFGNYTNSNTNDQRGGNGPFLLGTSITTPTVNSVGSNAGFGGIAYDSGPASALLFSSASTSIQFPFRSELNPYMNGEYRIIAKGFEVINTTSELNVQGLVTVYRQPCEPIDAAQSTTVVNALSSQYGVNFPSVIQTAMPPLGTQETLLLDGSKQWKAKEGCYVVPTLSAPDLPTGQVQVTPNMLLSAADPGRGVPPNNGSAWSMGRTAGNGIPNAFQYTPTGSSVTFLPLSFGASDFQNFNHAGAYFTGLSYETTLQLNVIYYIERFPSQQDSDLVVLARHSCRQDCVALDLYSEIVREMPVGVPQRMNGLGEWFADAVSSAADFISPVLSAIPHPYAQGAAMAVKTGGSIAKSLMAKKEAPGQTYSAQGANVSATGKAASKILGNKKKKSPPMKKKK